jgi:hypothetical protein
MRRNLVVLETGLADESSSQAIGLLGVAFRPNADLVAFIRA